jgi:hypothetical protein
VETQQYSHGRPIEGMACLCTMEDINDESGNYGKFENEKKNAWPWYNSSLKIHHSDKQ